MTANQKILIAVKKELVAMIPCEFSKSHQMHLCSILLLIDKGIYRRCRYRYTQRENKPISICMLCIFIPIKHIFYIIIEHNNKFNPM